MSKPASQASLRLPVDSVLRKYINKPLKTAKAASKSDRPIMLVTDSARMDPAQQATKQRINQKDIAEVQ